MVRRAAKATVASAKKTVRKRRNLLYKIEHPNRRTLRTVFQAFVGLCAAAPVLVMETGLSASSLPWLGVVLAAAAAVTRVMNTPIVEKALSRFLPWLASQPPAPDTDVTE